jgi:hypothetical protein
VAATGGATPGKLPRGKLEPGSAVGVQIIRGDVSGVATGTTSYVDEDKILAFGHPFFNGGRTSAPAVLSSINHIMSVQDRSFKMGTPIAVRATDAVGNVGVGRLTVDVKK